MNYEKLSHALRHDLQGAQQEVRLQVHVQAGGGGQPPGQGGRQSDQPHPGPRLVPRGVAHGGAEARGGAQGGPAARVLQVKQGSQHQPGAQDCRPRAGRRLQAGREARGRGRGAAPGLRQPGPGAAGRAPARRCLHPHPLEHRARGAERGRAGARDRGGGGERVGAGAGDRGGGDQAGLQSPGRGHLSTLLRWVTAGV